MQDHDILIEVRTQVKDMRSDMKELHTGIMQRMDAVERGKLDKTEAERLSVAADLIRKDHEERIRRVETACTEMSTTSKVQIRTWTVIMGVVSMLVSIALHFL